MKLDIDRCRNLFERIVRCRNGFTAAIFVSHLPASARYQSFAGDTYADACLHRLVKGSFRLTFSGRSLRWKVKWCSRNKMAALHRRKSCWKTWKQACSQSFLWKADPGLSMPNGGRSAWNPGLRRQTSWRMPQTCWSIETVVSAGLQGVLNRTVWQRKGLTDGEHCFIEFLHA